MTFQRAALGGALAALLAICAGCSLLDPHNLIGRQLGEATAATECARSTSRRTATLGAEAREQRSISSGRRSAITTTIRR